MTFLNNVRKVGRLVLSRTSCFSFQQSDPLLHPCAASSVGEMSYVRLPDANEYIRTKTEEAPPRPWNHVARKQCTAVT
jgi:hypothetical protein